jgi:hypothetical protein
MKSGAATIVPFPCASTKSDRRAQQNEFVAALRFSSSPVILDLTACGTLNQEDIALLLEGLAQLAARDTKVFLAASPVNQVVLEVTRISPLVLVFASVEQALARSQNPTESISSELGINTPATQGARQ